MGCVGAVNVSPVSPKDAAARPIRCRSFHEQHIITGKLGSGSFAHVYAVKHISGLQHMAVKITDLRKSRSGPDHGGIDDKARRKAIKEAGLLSEMADSPHVVHMVGDYLEGGFSYIVMERCDMSLFQALLRTPKLTERRLQPIACKMLQALAAVHRAGIVHRDIKPENFLCTSGCCIVKLCDFGLAARTQGPLGLKSISGTVPFMSPEMLLGHGYGLKTDVWSLGVTLYVLLFGEFPYQPPQQDPLSMRAAILRGSPEPSFKPRDGLGHGSGTISDAATRSVMALLQRSPRGRPSAEGAGALSWFKLKAHEMEGLDSHSLMPMLCSACKLGACPAPSKKGSAIDAMLSTLQAEVHGSSPLGPPTPSGGARRVSI